MRSISTCTIAPEKPPCCKPAPGRFTRRAARLWGRGKWLRQRNGVLVRGGDAVSHAAEAVDCPPVAQKPKRRRKIQRHGKRAAPAMRDLHILQHGEEQARVFFQMAPRGFA